MILSTSDSVSQAESTEGFVSVRLPIKTLCSFGKIEWSLFGPLLLSGFLFKILVAALDTPFLYAAVFAFRKRFGLKMGEELNLD